MKDGEAIPIHFDIYNATISLDFRRGIGLRVHGHEWHMAKIELMEEWVQATYDVWVL